MGVEHKLLTSLSARLQKTAEGVTSDYITPVVIALAFYLVS